MEKRLYRNEHDKKVAGVASGLADYMQVDITIVRLLFVLATIFLAGTGLLVYIIMWIILPVNNDPVARFNKFNDYFQKNQPNNNPFNSPNAFGDAANTAEQTKWNTPNVGPDFASANPGQFKKNDDTSRTIGGLILLIVGFYFLLRQFEILPEWFNIFKIYKLWPLAIVAVGISLIFRNQRKTEWDNFKKTTEEAQKAGGQNTVEDATIIVDDTDSTKSNP